ncbi:MAG: glycosyltransferase family 2 protein [Candidatus Omnitrophica bacterium]|nr:glycosyltransferase family 2 protein [Candidatus Omnitrophota bacterium]
MYDLCASIVTFKNDQGALKKAINSFLNENLKSYLYVVDNSPTDSLRNSCIHRNVEYIFNNKNLGFGAAHNQVLVRMLDESKYHLILNPDVYFSSGALEKLFSFMERNDEIGLLMPKVLYPDGALQYLCRLLPTPLDLLLRKFDNQALRAWINLISKYELRFADYNKQMDVPYLSGCFMFIRTGAFKRAGIFDERFFIYFEDVDLSRRINRLYRTVYYPQVEVYHGYERGSNKDAVLLKHLIRSGIRYFNKWGWFFDQERKLINKQTLENL